MSQTTIYDEKFIIGEVDRVIFTSESSHFNVLKVLVHETNTEFIEEAIITGYFHEILEGETYRFVGESRTHHKYGMQFNAQQFSKEIPNTKKGIIDYLSSDSFYGIGRQTAQSIVDVLGADALKKIANNSEVLDDVPKLSAKKKSLIYQTIIENKETENVYIRLNELGFGPKVSAKILKTYKEETYKVITEKPYQLIYDIEGIGFKTADNIAYKSGISKTNEERLKAAILFIVKDHTIAEGHTFLYDEEVFEKVNGLLNNYNYQYFSYNQISLMINDLFDDNQLVKVENRIYIPSLFYAEYKSAQAIFRLMDAEQDNIDDNTFSIINDIQSRLNITYNDDQIIAIKNAVIHKVSIITGGPGTGKTTLVKGLIEFYSDYHEYDNIEEYEENEYPIKIAAPTGRAAKRLTETTGIQGSTIHRLIGWNQDTERDAEIDNEIQADLIIIDEMSMVDTWLFHQLMKNVKDSTHIVFVGDKDQLASVGPGSIFKDLILSNIIPVTQLNTVYRQGEGSSIVKLAHDINTRQSIDITEKYKDRLFIESNIEQIPLLVENVVSKAVDKGYNMRDIQVLAPIYRGEAGINNLNSILQNVLNPPTNTKNELEYGQVVFREGDKVLQTVNRVEDNIFNGDMGIVLEITNKALENDRDSILVAYDENTVMYEKKDLIELTHAYCTSIHKAQGSEYSIVIMPIVKSYNHMLYRNIIYTGITRAKESLIICGSSRAFYQSLNQEEVVRQTSFKQMLYDVFSIETEKSNSTDFSDEKTEHILTINNMYTIHPMINVDKSPYEFIDNLN